MRAPAALAILLLASFSFAWWDSSFQYRAPINISSSFNLTDYHVQVSPQIYNNTGLIGSWHFSEGSGSSATDASGSGSGGTIGIGAGGTQANIAQARSNGASGKFGSALSLDGTDDYVELSNPTSFDVFSAGASGKLFTFEAWIKFNKVPTGADAASFFSAYSSLYPALFRYMNGQFQLWIYSGGWQIPVTATITPQAGVWYHLAYVKSSSSVWGIYINGTNYAVGTNPYTSSVPSNVYLGVYAPGTFVFNGTMDEVRIYNRSLSASEVQEHYNATKARLDYADVRFTYFNASSSTESPVPFWQESDKSIWLKTYLASGNNTLYMYYGNASTASASNSSASSPPGDLATSAQAVSSGDYSIGPVGYKPGAFDNNLVSSQSANTGWFSANTIDASGGAVWIGQNFTGGRTIKRYNVLVDIDPTCVTLSMCPFRVPYAWTFEGSNDASFSTKDILDNQTGYNLSDSVWASFNLSSPAPYQYYRMRITKTGTGISNTYAFVTEMEMIGFDPVSPAPTVIFGAAQQDNVAPVVSIQSPLNQTYANSTTQINFTASDNIAISSCVVRLDGVINSSSCSNYSLVLANGAYVLNVTANDTTGNVNSAQVSFTVEIDSIPPSVSIQSPANDTYNSTSIPLDFTASDASGISSCSSELNGVNTTLPGCANTSITAVNGSNSLTLWASDGTNWGSSSVSFTVSLPQQQPPANNTTAPISNSTTTDSFGIGNATLNGIPSGATRLALTIGSQTQAKIFSFSSGVTSVRVSARATVKGTPASGKTLSFEIS